MNRLVEIDPIRVTEQDVITRPPPMRERTHPKRLSRNAAWRCPLTSRMTIFVASPLSLFESKTKRTECLEFGCSSSVH
jgi:hypothetical protein